MIIDFHAHFAREEKFAERIIEQLPKAGIDRICLCSAGEYFGHASNEEILRAAQQYPRQITALALIQLGEDPPELVDDCVRRGFSGFKIMNPSHPYDDQGFFPVYERMERSGLPLLAHTGIVMHTPADRERHVSSRKMMPSCLDAVVRAFPKLNVIGAHLGAPWHEEASMMARMHPNYYVDLTGAWWGGWRANKGPDFYRYHFFWPGAWDKVLFGTDILKAEELIPSKQFHDKLIADLGLPEKTVQNIYGGTAARLLGLGA